MKKILILSVIIFCAVVLHAQKNIAPSKVPAAAKEAFVKAHPNVNARWEKEDADYEVTFKKAGKDVSCVIDKAGTIKETETAMPVGELPAPVTAYIARHYKGAKAKEAAAIVKAGGTTVYEAEVNGKDVLFDAQGNPLKTKKDND